MANLVEGEEFAGGFLSHFGVKGMKWGRRKDDSGGGTTATKVDDSDDARAAKEVASKVKAGGTSSVSNKELRLLVDRMGLEKRFKEINTPAAKKKNPILQGVVWTTKKAATLTGQSMEQVIKVNLSNEMNQRLKQQLGKS